MNVSLIQDFDNLSFDDWLDFVFEAKWSRLGDKDWMELSDIDADIEVFVGNCVKLFEDPEFLLKRYDEKQLERGFFGFILSPHAGLNWWLWDKNQSEDLRRRFIFSSVNFFKQIFTVNPLEHSCYMWWDCLRYFGDKKDLKVADWIFGALSQILEIDNQYCRLSALHGLGHIEHKGKKDLIEKNFKTKS